jgi:hypothetical protein
MDGNTLLAVFVECHNFDAERHAGCHLANQESDIFVPA